jgi:hypothetical protein
MAREIRRDTEMTRERRRDILMTREGEILQWLSKSMTQVQFVKAGSCLTSHDITRLQLNPKVHYHAMPLMGPIISHMNPIHIFTLYSSKIHFSTVLPPSSKWFMWSVPFRVSGQHFVCVSSLCTHNYTEKQDWIYWERKTARKLLLAGDEQQRMSQRKRERERERERDAVFKNIRGLDTKPQRPTAKFLLPHCSVAN